jgi:hypothetical protein
MANEPVAAPVPPPGGASLEPRTVAPGRGMSWWEEGWRLFVPNVGAWLLITVIVFCLQLAAAQSAVFCTCCLSSARCFRPFCFLPSRCCLPRAS